MTRRSRYTADVIAAKLLQAEQLAREGKTQDEIARALGISVVTYHRWRRSNASQSAERAATGQDHALREAGRPVNDLIVENERLRRLVSDLLLEKVGLEEQIQKLPRRGDG